MHRVEYCIANGIIELHGITNCRTIQHDKLCSPLMKMHSSKSLNHLAGQRSNQDCVDFVVWVDFEKSCCLIAFEKRKMFLITLKQRRIW